jgi:hypothetical protein
MSPVVVHANGPQTGYSYKTNQYGLSIDNIVGFNLVLPNSTVVYVTEPTYPDLFFGLKGGFNNFVNHLSPIPSPANPTDRVLGDRDRFHNEDIPTNRSMGMLATTFTDNRYRFDSQLRADRSHTPPFSSINSEPPLQISRPIPRTQRLLLFPRT